VSLLVTGGNGFVMSNLVRRWLEDHSEGIVTILDRDAPDEASRRYFAGVQDRLRWIRCDILDRSWHEAAAGNGIDRIVHGAAVTPHPWIGADGTTRDPEREDPEHALEVNLGGTLAVLAFARTLPNLERLLLVGTASIYGEGRSPHRPFCEEDPVAPTALYGISKHAAELVAKRFAILYRLPVVVARLGAVYGPMDRVLDSRHIVCAPNQITTLALGREAIGVDDPDGLGDWIHATDVAVALSILVGTQRPRHVTYNVASGRPETLARLADLISAQVPGSMWAANPRCPNVFADSGRRPGRWGGYDIARMGKEFGWAPAPLERRLAEYVAWRKGDLPAAAPEPGVE
jgi:nucleoside-diphosphate-sugar epimerase